MIVTSRRFAMIVCAMAGVLTSGCAVQMPSFAMPGSGTPAPRAALAPKAPLPDSQRLGASDLAGGVPYTAPKPQAVAVVAKPGEKLVTVGPEDTLLTLSRTHGVPVTMLMSTNNLSNLTLEQGQILRIPSLGPKR
jgi:LysM repeat protein